MKRDSLGLAKRFSAQKTAQIYASDRHLHFGAVRGSVCFEAGDRIPQIVVGSQAILRKWLRGLLSGPIDPLQSGLVFWFTASAEHLNGPEKVKGPTRNPVDPLISQVGQVWPLTNPGIGKYL